MLLAFSWTTSRACDTLSRLFRAFGVGESEMFRQLIESLEQRALFAATPLLPDLAPWVDQNKGYLYNWSIDTTQIAGHTLLRLTSASSNVGQGKMEIRGGADNGDGTQQVYQRIYNSDGTFTDRFAGNFVYHPAHNHIHFEDFAQYNLRARPDDNSVGAVVSDGSKTSFCLEDVDSFNKSLPGAPQSAVYTACTAVLQGISIGWADVYRSYLEGQWIDVTGIPDGKYWLEIVDDPDNHLMESDDTNNVSRIAIDLHMNDNTLATAYDLGVLSSTKSFDEFVGSADKHDYYKFSLTGPASFSLAANSLFADADVQLLDSNGAVVKQSTNGGNSSEFINASLNAGTYYVHVLQFNGDTSYHLELSSVAQIAPNLSFIKSGDTWKYLDNGSNQATAWRNSVFDDSTWKSGKSQLGYGDGDEATIVSYGSNSNSKFITTYFRKAFSVANPANITALQLQLLRDDGAVVYLNGQEIVRSNMPAGTIGYTTLAPETIGGADESTFASFAINPALLVSGTNVIAVEIHQSVNTSSDVSFDLKLDAVSSNVQPPVAPTNLLALAISSSQIKLTWTDVALDNSGYAIERGTDGFNFSPLITVGDVSTYTDSGLPGGSKFYYQVRAVTGALSSGYSNISSDTTPIASAPAVPTNLLAAAISTSQIKLTWTDNATDNTGYAIERSTDGVSFSPLTTVGDVSTYTNSGLASGAAFYYRLRATNGALLSGYSNISGATTQIGVSLIAPGSTGWRYLDNGTNQGTGWRATGFSDSAWKTGKAQLGYGDGDEATVVSFGPNAGAKYTTTYFRKSFTVADPSQIASLTAQLIRDDGAVVYLNGTEIWRSNMPTGTIAYTTKAATVIPDADESRWFSSTVAPSLLIAGTNVIAVEVHQANSTSSDISFDFQLSGVITPATPPPPAAPAIGSLFSSNAIAPTNQEVLN